SGENAETGPELVPRPVRREGGELIEAAGRPVADLRGDGADPGGLLAGEAGMPNRPGDVLLRNAGEAVGRNLADPGAQCLESAALVRDGRALREHGRGPDLEGRHRPRPILGRIASLEDAHRSKEGASVH